MPVRRGMTKAQEIAADLRRQIENRELAPGAVLPSESKLMSQYGYSRETVRAGCPRSHRRGAGRHRMGTGQVRP